MTGDRDKGPSVSRQNERLLHEPDASEAIGVSRISEQVADRLTGNGRFREAHNKAVQEAMKDPLFRQAEEEARLRSGELADKKRARLAKEFQQALDDSEKPDTLSQERRKEVIRILRAGILRQRRLENPD